MRLPRLRARFLPGTRRRATLLVAVVVLLPAADWLACLGLRHRLRVEYAAWVATVSAQGWTVHSDQISEGGFPLGATLTLTGFGLSGGHAMLPGGLDWRAERLVASVPLGRHPVDRLTLEADGLTAGLAQSRRQDLRVEHLSLSLQANRRGAAHVTAAATLSASGIGLPDNARWPLGDRIKSFGCALDLTSPALSGAAAIDQARAWRDWGGALSVHDLRLEWGPADLRAQARLGLDKDLQPEGKGTATLTGWAQAVDALAAGGSMPAGMAETVKMVLGLMAPAAAGGDALTLPLGLKNSTLSMGKIPVAQLRAIRWNGI